MTDPRDTDLPNKDVWSPPNSDQGYSPGQERRPWAKWIISALLVGIVVLAAIWLMAKVIVPQGPLVDPSRIDRSDEPAQTTSPPPKSADEQAWVRALERDTLEAYRDYLKAFPNGRYKDKAQAAIDQYDHKAWAEAEKRDTVAAYEDYLAGWPQGLHADKARERITAMKAKRDAQAKDAAERAAREAHDWQQAAAAHTISAYQTYLSQHPAGAHAEDAYRRIETLKGSAADQAAWETAKAAHNIAAYERYLASFANGQYAAEAIKAIETLRPAAGKIFQDCDICPPMVSLPSGQAALGAGENEPGVRPNEMPKRPVIFANMFAISVTEITFDQWQACVNAQQCRAISNDNGWGRGNRPVIQVSWDDAQTYIGWLSAKTGFDYSLPSEAQWEYAARGGDAGVWMGGSQKALCAFANGAGTESGLGWANPACGDMASDRTLPAGMLSANPFGVKDMIGNVAEWTLDCNTLNLNDAPTDGSADLRGSCQQRVIRGGSWFSGPADLRYGARIMQRRADSNDFTGFRVIRTVKP